MTIRGKALAAVAALALAGSLGFIAVAGPEPSGRSDAGSPPAAGMQTDAAPSQDDEGRGRRPTGVDSSAYSRVTAIDSADSCQLSDVGKDKIRASGDCPGVKTCTLQERAKGSVQTWKDSAANPDLKGTNREYRADCI